MPASDSVGAKRCMACRRAVSSDNDASAWAGAGVRTTGTFCQCWAKAGKKAAISCGSQGLAMLMTGGNAVCWVQSVSKTWASVAVPMWLRRGPCVWPSGPIKRSSLNGLALLAPCILSKNCPAPTTLPIRIWQIWVAGLQRAHALQASSIAHLAWP